MKFLYPSDKKVVIDELNGDENTSENRRFSVSRSGRFKQKCKHREALHATIFDEVNYIQKKINKFVDTAITKYHVYFVLL